MNLLYRRNIMYPQQTYLRWLSASALQAIVGAFGADGMAVIKATNAYLNQLAASDRDKATALAGFINEDPMMVCSLGLSVEGVTMPIRWLVGDGNSWVDTGVKPISSYDYECRVKNASMNMTWIFGSRAEADSGLNTTALNLYSSSQIRCYKNSFGDSSIRQNVPSYGGFALFKSNGRTYNFNGTNYNYNTQTHTQCDVTLCIFTLNIANISYATAAFDLPFFVITDGINKVWNGVPFKSATREGMVDLVTGTFHPNQGTGHFTDAYTLQDGVTPWTPSTP